MNFSYHNPIHFEFGLEALGKIPELCKGHKVLLVYGGGSIKRNGVYDHITGPLNSNEIPFVEYANQTTATWQGIQDGIVLAHENDISAVIEVGGASAMDTGKAIAFGAVHENLADYIEGKAQPDENHLLNIIIPTYPSTGSEANGVCDIMEYNGYGVELFGAWPDYCLMNPSTTLSLDKRSTAYSAWVCFIQTSAWFIGNHRNEIARGFARASLQTILQAYQRLMEQPDDIKARGDMMWASCVDTMGVFRSGIDNFYPWTLYSVGYIPRVAHGVSYREALVAAFPHWLRAAAEYHPKDIRALFVEVFGLDARMDTDALVESGCQQIERLIAMSGVPMDLSVHGECPAFNYVKKSLAAEDFGEFSPEELYQIIRACYGQTDHKE